MLWRVRTTLTDRPGALAVLATSCAAAGVDVRRLQVLPDSARSVEGDRDTASVTDELVLEAPALLDQAGVSALVDDAGGTGTWVMACTEAALADQPTRYVEAARSVLVQPSAFLDVVSHLFDADTETAGSLEHADTMTLMVGDVEVTLRRSAPFTVTERERGRVMAALVSDVSSRDHANAGLRRVRPGASVSYLADRAAVRALADDVVVGRARLHPEPGDEPGLREVDIDVDLAWQRRGIGARLLLEAARLARSGGAEELMVRARADNQAVMPMVLSAGLRGRIRMSGEQLTVRIALRDLRGPRPA